MVRLNVSIIIPDSSKAGEIIDVATRIVEGALREKGCIDFDLYRSTTNDDRLLIVETWQTGADLEHHLTSPNYRNQAPRLKELANVTVERFDF